MTCMCLGRPSGRMIRSYKSKAVVALNVSSLSGKRLLLRVSRRARHLEHAKEARECVCYAAVINVPIAKTRHDQSSMKDG